jgi:tetratricopeptide (TPR) repeat protein
MEGEGSMDDKTRAIKQRAAKFAEKGQTAKAIREFEALLEQVPGDTRTLHRLGELWAKENKISKAIEYFWKAADGYLEEGFADRAMAVLKQALTLDPLRQELNQRLAEALAKKGLERDAARHLLKAAALYQEKGLAAEELEALTKAVELAPADPDTHLRLAELHLRQEKPDAAREELLRAALELKKTERTDDLISTAEKVIGLGEASVELFRALAEAYIKKADWEKARKALQKPLSAKSDDPATLGLSARVHLGLNDAAGAVGVYKRMARLARRKGDEELAREADEKLREIATARGQAPEPLPPPPVPARRGNAPKPPSPPPPREPPEEGPKEPPRDAPREADLASPPCLDEDPEDTEE